MMKNIVFLLIGGNIGNKLQLIEQAESLIEQQIGTIIKKSSIYETEPWGFTAENNFLNAVLLVETELSPSSVLQISQKIENILGRKRTTSGYASRTMDIDILFFNDLILNTELLVIPHPKLHERKFTLLPLQEIAPHKIHPAFEMDVCSLSMSCNDKSKVNVFKKR